MGIAALAVSTGGVVTAAHPGLVGNMSQQSVQVVASNALNGVSGTSRNSQLAERREAVSRDSSRAEAAEAADEKAVDEAEEKADQRAQALAKVSQKADQQEKKIELNRWTLPVTSYSISASFGQSSGLWSNGHTGLDFNTSSGAPIYSIANGTVTETGYDGAYGNKTVVTLDDGTEIWYAHQTSYTVTVGDFVRSGQLIGYVGSTGNVTGAHLHLEVRPGGGDPVDPYAALVANHIQP
jgi:murein DD-endopeptidase MepM/ murein hydrolase activator NlpD